MGSWWCKTRVSTIDFPWFSCFLSTSSVCVPPTSVGGGEGPLCLWECSKARGRREVWLERGGMWGGVAQDASSSSVYSS